MGSVAKALIIVTLGLEELREVRFAVDTVVQGGVVRQTEQERGKKMQFLLHYIELMLFRKRHMLKKSPCVTGKLSLFHGQWDDVTKYKVAAASRQCEKEHKV